MDWPLKILSAKYFVVNQAWEVVDRPSTCPAVRHLQPRPDRAAVPRRPARPDPPRQLAADARTRRQAQPRHQPRRIPPLGLTAAGRVWGVVDAPPHTPDAGASGVGLAAFGAGGIGCDRRGIPGTRRVIGPCPVPLHGTCRLSQTPKNRYTYCSRSDRAAVPSRARRPPGPWRSARRPAERLAQHLVRCARRASAPSSARAAPRRRT